jgi:hypothetical protein
MWKADRHRHQGRIVADLYSGGARVPRQREAVLVGGLRGSDKDRELARAAIDRARYLAVGVDVVLLELARRSMIPVVAGLSPLEGAGLVHAEAQHIAKRLAALAAADGRNLLLDVTMASPVSVRSWLSVLDKAAYSVDVVIAELPAAEAVRRSDAEHRRAQEAYQQGRGNGGRKADPAAIHAAARAAQEVAGSDWPAILSHLRRRRRPSFPASDVTILIGSYRAGRLTLPGLTRQLAIRAWPQALPVTPPGLELAAAAIDDLEPWTPGSFDEVILAADRGILTEADYAAIAAALT